MAIVRMRADKRQANVDAQVRGAAQDERNSVLKGYRLISERESPHEVRMPPRQKSHKPDGIAGPLWRPLPLRSIARVGTPGLFLQMPVPQSAAALQCEHCLSKCEQFE